MNLYSHPELKNEKLAEWLTLVATFNRHALDSYVPEKESYESIIRRKRSRLGRVIAKASRQVDSLQAQAFRMRTTDKAYAWPIALNALGAECMHCLDDTAEDFESLRGLYDRSLSQDGEWLVPVSWVEECMKGYSLLYVAELSQDERYKIGADRLAESLLTHHPRMADGSLAYRPSMQHILVDTLGMMCPFLTRYSRQTQSEEALDLCLLQIRNFAQCATDSESHLPFHGYEAGGPRRLGLHGWGRGTGWYMLGLIGTLADMPVSHSDYDYVAKLFLSAADTLRRFQRPDGHWSWAIPQAEDTADSSTTAFVGYSLARGLQLGLLDGAFHSTVNRAIDALIASTAANGVIDGALGDCAGLGKYPQQYGPRMWTQGMATAFGAVTRSLGARNERSQLARKSHRWNGNRTLSGA